MLPFGSIICNSFVSLNSYKFLGLNSEMLLLVGGSGRQLSVSAELHTWGFANSISTLQGLGQNKDLFPTGGNHVIEIKS